MNHPDELPDPLLDAYRRASAAEAGGPDPLIRARILKRAREAAPPPRASAMRWRIAAGVVGLGLAGLLALQPLRPTPTARVAAATAAPQRESALPPEPEPQPAPAPASAPAPLAAARTAAPTARVAAVAPLRASTPPAAASAAAARVQAPRPEGERAGLAGADPWPARVRAAVASRYPDLRAADAEADTASPASVAPVSAPVTMVRIVLNGDGTVYSSSQGALAPGTAPDDAAIDALLRQEAGPAAPQLVRRGSLAAGPVLVVYGILGDTRAPAAP